MLKRRRRTSILLEARFVGVGDRILAAENDDGRLARMPRGMTVDCVEEWGKNHYHFVADKDDLFYRFVTVRADRKVKIADSVSTSDLVLSSMADRAVRYDNS